MDTCNRVICSVTDFREINRANETLLQKARAAEKCIPAEKIPDLSK